MSTNEPRSVDAVNTGKHSPAQTPPPSRQSLRGAAAAQAGFDYQLDVSILAQVINLLNELRHQLNLTIMFIAHDLPVVRDFADHVMVMEKGEVVEIGTVRAIFETPQHPYTRRLLAAGLDPDPEVQKARRLAPV